MYVIAREWMEAAGEQLAEMSQGRRLIWIDDGQIGHCMTLATAESVKTALRDYANTYDTADYVGELTVGWQLWEYGKQVNSGVYSWEVANMSYLAPF